VLERRRFASRCCLQRRAAPVTRQARQESPAVKAIHTLIPKSEFSSSGGLSVPWDRAAIETTFSVAVVDLVVDEFIVVAVVVGVVIVLQGELDEVVVVALAVVVAAVEPRRACGGDTPMLSLVAQHSVKLQERPAHRESHASASTATEALDDDVVVTSAEWTLVVKPLFLLEEFNLDWQANLLLI